MPRPDIDKDPRFSEAVAHMQLADQLLQECLKEGMSLGHARRLLMLRAGLIDPRSTPRKSIHQPQTEMSSTPDTRPLIDLNYGENLEFDYHSGKKSVTHTTRGVYYLSQRQDRLMYSFTSQPNIPLDISALREVGEWPEYVPEYNIKSTLMELRRIADEKIILPNGQPKKHNGWKHIRSAWTRDTLTYTFNPNGAAVVD